ncbi:MAG TPA: copper-binding protein [Bryobacteraceae bacterium]|nr:copper-binding protein [Bryobacteraceae bacterium]
MRLAYVPVLLPLPLAVLLPLAAGTVSCGSKPAAEPKQYPLRGQVVRLDPAAKTATIDAQKIEGWMEAMSMEYPVKDPNDFAKLQPNQCIDATVMVRGTEYWVADVKPAHVAPGACLGTKTPAETK